MPLVSVVIPLYNKEQTLARAISSVLSQTMPAFELLIVDDGSTDAGPGIAAAMDDARITVFSQENRGVSSARNVGIRMARGDYIAFLDADDEWEPSFLSTVLALAETYPEAGAYATGYAVHNASGGPVLACTLPGIEGNTRITRFFRLQAQMPHRVLVSSNYAIRKETVQAIGFFDEEAHWGEDSDYAYRIALACPIAYDVGMHAIVHYEERHRRPCHHPFVRKGKALLTGEGMPPADAEDLSELIALHELVSASQYLYDGQRQVARKILHGCATKRYTKKRGILLAVSVLPTVLYRMASAVLAHGRGPQV